ncbi:MAG: hypothetical protein ACTSX1_09445, partial [Candidatus Heimdallarchaeaceae archaeon]
REKFKNLKAGKYSLSKLFKDEIDTCGECLVNPACTRSLMNNTACDEFKEKIKEVLRENKVRFCNK